MDGTRCTHDDDVVADVIGLRHACQFWRRTNTMSSDVMKCRRAPNETPHQRQRHECRARDEGLCRATNLCYLQKSQFPMYLCGYVFDKHHSINNTLYQQCFVSAALCINNTLSTTLCINNTLSTTLLSTTLCISNTLYQHFVSAMLCINNTLYQQHFVSTILCINDTLYQQHFVNNTFVNNTLYQQHSLSTLCISNALYQQHFVSTTLFINTLSTTMIPQKSTFSKTMSAKFGAHLTNVTIVSQDLNSTLRDSLETPGSHKYNFTLPSATLVHKGRYVVKTITTNQHTHLLTNNITAIGKQIFKCCHVTTRCFFQ